MRGAAPRVLVADDQPDVCEALKLLLKSEGYSTETIHTPEGIVKAVERQDFDLLLDGFELRARHDVRARRTRFTQTVERCR